MKEGMPNIAGSDEHAWYSEQIEREKQKIEVLRAAISPEDVRARIEEKRLDLEEMLAQEEEYPDRPRLRQRTTQEKHPYLHQLLTYVEQGYEAWKAEYMKWQKSTQALDVADPKDEAHLLSLLCDQMTEYLSYQANEEFEARFGMQSRANSNVRPETYTNDEQVLRLRKKIAEMYPAPAASEPLKVEAKEKTNAGFVSWLKNLF